MKKLVVFICLLIILGLCFVFSINDWVIESTKDLIIDQTSDLEGYDAILILGAGVSGNSPSPMLEDRLKKGIEVYFQGAASKIIMSGDHSREDYDEVNVMKDYATKMGVPSVNVFMDHAGFSTYDSLYRAKEIFKANKIIIVTQEYHLYRALYIAKSLGLEAIGIPAIKTSYRGDSSRELREVLARNKDFFLSIIKPYPTYLGEEIPVFGDGNITND